MSKIDLSEWDRWFNKFVKPLFIPQGRDEYLERLRKNQAPFYPTPWVAERFFEKIRSDNRFDEELKLFFSFLYSCGFFLENAISFEQWLRMPNWWQPHLKEANEKTILEILNDSDGLDNLKFKIKDLPFLTRPEKF